ncbi:MAG: arsenate reductase (glutaredoxin) [Betaproteobacteria bacterium]|nr:arsenate reductase (glutaredoxin) [Betaproteobacteria bacterium]
MTQPVKIYHNPRCSKSRQALALLQDKGISPEVIEYLKTPLDRKALADLVARLGLPASAIVRKSEDVFKQHYAGKQLSEAEWIDALAEHPILMERPIVVAGDRAVVGRPPENVLGIV